MVNRKELNFKSIEDWALAHGFQKMPDNKLSAPYGEGSVLIEFLTRDIRVSSVCGQHIQRLITTHPKRLYIDENDMLQGAGLFSSFYTAYRDRPDCASMPVWFGEKVQAMIAEQVAKEQETLTVTH